MNLFMRLRIGRHRTRAYFRLQRMRQFNDIIERLASHRGGKTFNVDTEGLKLDPPFITVKERFSLLKLLYASQVGVCIMYNQRRLEIVSKDDCLTYMIY